MHLSCVRADSIDVRSTQFALFKISNIAFHDGLEILKLHQSDILLLLSISQIALMSMIMILSSKWTSSFTSFWLLLLWYTSIHFRTAKTAVEQYFRVVLFVFCFVVQCGYNFLICGSNHAMWPFFGKLLNSSLMWCCLFCGTVWF